MSNDKIVAFHRRAETAADDVWEPVLHPDFLTEFNRLASAIQAASRSRQEARAKKEATPAQRAG